MTKRKSPDRERRWDKVFNALVKLSQNLQEERTVLEERVKYLNGVIHKMKLERQYISAKSEHLLGLKERNALICKRRCEIASRELADLREGFGYLCEKRPEAQVSSDEVAVSKGNHRTKTLREEAERLKSELEKCTSEKNSLISAHSAEKNFVWNQYERLESGHAEQISRKDAEIETANEKVGALVNKVEELHVSNERLKTRISKVESESSQKNVEISRLKKEIETLKSELLPNIPSLRQCSSQSGKQHNIGGKSSTANGKDVRNEKEPISDTPTVEKTTRTRETARKSTGGKAPRRELCLKGSSSSSSKRKSVETEDMLSYTPKLFSSSFKVPKLKPSASVGPA